MIGKIEQENKIRAKINKKLSGLPYIFTEFYNYMESDQKSYATIQHYIDYVAEFMNFTTLGVSDKEFYKNVTVPQIREYIISLRRREDGNEEVKNSDSIQATKWSALNTFYNFLVMDDYISINPMTKTKRPKNRKQNEVVYLEKNEINQILDTIKQEAHHTMVNRDLAIVMLGIATGLRVAAIVQINIDDIDFKENTIKVLEKGGKERLVKFSSNIRGILSQWIMDRGTYFEETETDALFISQRRERITTEGLRKVLQKYTQGINKHITPHSLRKTTATQAYISGADIRTIASQLNHSSIQTTMRYAAAVDSKQKEMITNLDNLF